MPTFLPVELVDARHDNVGEGLEAQEALQGRLLAGKVDDVPGAVEVLLALGSVDVLPMSWAKQSGEMGPACSAPR
eukprot:9501515-Pyramimonas_sp.AAC.1